MGFGSEDEGKADHCRDPENLTALSTGRIFPIDFLHIPVDQIVHDPGILFCHIDA